MVASKDADLHLSTDDARLIEMLKALGNPTRFQIMKTLADCRMCMTQQIVDTTPLAQSTVSQHLAVLRQAGLIRGQVEGPATCYCLDEDGIRWLKDQIERWLPNCCKSEVGAVVFRRFYRRDHTA